MIILILGASGMLGTKLAQALFEAGRLGDQPIAKIVCADLAPPQGIKTNGVALETVVGDITRPDIVQKLIADAPDVIFHLAAVVSGEAEQDFDKGYRVNLAGTQALFEAIRAVHIKDGYCPRLVFTSSIAVFGGPYPEKLPDTFFASPSNSYGTQKAMIEMLLSDYTRRSFFDGIALRLPTICIRPGAPNKAASSFFSGILREPLAGQRAILPVPDSVRAWLASPRSAIANLILAGAMDTNQLDHHRVLNLPGLSATVAQQIEALRDTAGQSAVDLIRRQPDETITRIVASWPPAFDAQRALALGFVAESSVHEIIAVYLDDEQSRAGV